MKMMTVARKNSFSPPGSTLENFHQHQRQQDQQMSFNSFLKALPTQQPSHQSSNSAKISMENSNSPNNSSNTNNNLHWYRYGNNQQQQQQQNQQQNQQQQKGFFPNAINVSDLRNISPSNSNTTANNTTNFYFGEKIHCQKQEQIHQPTTNWWGMQGQTV